MFRLVKLTKTDSQRCPNLNLNKLKQLAVLKQKKIIDHSDSIYERLSESNATRFFHDNEF